MSHSKIPKSPAPADPGDERTFTLLKQIQSGRLDPTCIATASRRQLVVAMMSDGYSTAEIAEILKVSDRTIERDRKAIREANAVSRDPKLVEQIIGRLIAEAELCAQRMRKAARDKEASPMVRIEAEHRCYQILTSLVESLQRLGYLPTAAQKLEADLTHHAGALPEFGVLEAEVLRLKEVTRQLPGGDADERLAQLEQTLSRARLATEVEALSSDLESEGEIDDSKE